MNLKTKIRIESKSRAAISLILNHIKNEFLGREFIEKNEIVNIDEYFIETGTKVEKINYIDITCSGRMNKLLIPVLIDKHTMGIDNEIYDEIFIKITPEDSNKVGDIGNMVYDQFVGHKDYIDNNVVLNIDNGTDVRIWIEKDSCKFPIFFLSKFYKPFS